MPHERVGEVASHASVLLLEQAAAQRGRVVTEPQLRDVPALLGKRVEGPLRGARVRARARADDVEVGCDDQRRALVGIQRGGELERGSARSVVHSAAAEAPAREHSRLISPRWSLSEVKYVYGESCAYRRPTAGSA